MSEEQVPENASTEDEATPEVEAHSADSVLGFQSAEGKDAEGRCVSTISLFGES
jgi:hypothetical protein